MITTERLKKVQ